MKGFTNTIEAVIGAVIILSVMMWLFQTPATQETSSYSMAYNCLKYAKDSANVDAKLRECIPISYNYQFKVCGSDCSAALPSNVTVTSADYISNGKIMKLWMYR